MIERKFVKEKLREFQVKEYIDSCVPGAGHSDTQIKRTPLGDRVVITAAKPGLVVGRKGENIRAMTLSIKKKFGLENPQLEIEELAEPFLDAAFVGERVARSLERLGIARFKSIAHKMLEDVMRAGALGVEILFSGKIPGERARTWRFWQGYMKKSGSVSQRDVRKSIKTATLKTGVVGIVVRILPPTVALPDDIKFLDEGGISARLPHLEEIRKVGGGRIEDEVGDASDTPVVTLDELDKVDAAEIGVDLAEIAELVPQESTEPQDAKKTSTTKKKSGERKSEKQASSSKKGTATDASDDADADSADTDSGDAA